MKSIYNKDNRLESHRIFPYIAWFVLLSLSYFVYTVIIDLQANIEQLREENQLLKVKTQMPVDQIQDFSR